MSLSRRQFFWMGAGALVAGATAEGLYVPQEAMVSEVTIQLKRLPKVFDGFRVAQLSDIHFNTLQTSTHMEEVVKKTNSLRPDLILLTGDFVSASLDGRHENAHAEQAWPCSKFLRNLQATFGCYGVLGNHDYHSNAEIVTSAVETEGQIRILRNRSEPIERNGARIWLTGIDNVTAQAVRPERALRGLPPDECKLVAVHEPDFADVMRRFAVDFQLSGHSHGGQIRCPLMGAIYLPRLARKYPMGHYVLGDYQLYTNRGIGMTGVPVRFLCPPEITLFTLKSA